ncbi:MAG: acetylxylan esterase [Planctomycetes bacterium]|nr:acetylxylan esterase [Planctomycetota bacterium]
MDNPPWNMDALAAPPRTLPAEGFDEPGVEGLFYEGPAFRGRPTRVFAWLGLPDAAAGAKVPGIVLVHGGAGSAFAGWVRQWQRRGYAAIAMDTCGRVPRTGLIEPGIRHDHAGPDGWGGWDQLDWPVADQWPYHAVADVILAHSLLASLERVDARRIGLMGISWGAYLACIAAAIDGRFRFAAAVYGCGFLKQGGSPIYFNKCKAIGADRYRLWSSLWDPRHYLPSAKLPILWTAGTNDLGFSMGSRKLSCRAAAGPASLSIRLRWKHCYENPWRSREIPAFADRCADLAAVGLPAIGRQGRSGRTAWVEFSAEAPAAAELCYTRSDGPWPSRCWQKTAAQVDTAAGRAFAELPAGVSTYFFNLTDARGRLVSSEHVDIEAP